MIHTWQIPAPLFVPKVMTYATEVYQENTRLTLAKSTKAEEDNVTAKHI